jgi:hypothetical protein
MKSGKHENNDEHRHMLENRLTPLALYKLTPRTNCRECGFASCLAFATQVIAAQAPVDGCPYLDAEAVEPFRRQLAGQHEAGIGVRREGFEKALQFLRGEIKKWDFQTIAGSLGAACLEADGSPALKLLYLDKEVTVTQDDIMGSPTGELNPWEKILIYNYVIGGAVEPAGVWLGMESLPNSVSKIKSLKAHCENRLAQAFAGNMERLPPAISGLGAAVNLVEEKVDFAAELLILPKFPVRILWWDEDREEGFEAQTKFLFDARVMETLDLESILFACEQITERLLE